MSRDNRKKLRGRATVESNEATSKQAAVFHAWLEARELGFEGAPPVAAVLLYLLERAAGTWRPARSKVPSLKYESLRIIPSAIASHYRAAGHDVTHLEDSDEIREMVHNLRKRLPTDQVAKKRAVPLVEARLHTVLDFLDRLAKAAVVHTLWAMRWTALLHTARAAGLRASEIMRLRVQWISRHTTSAGPAYLITIPYSKSQNDPKTVAVTALIPGGAEACEALDRWFAALRAAGYTLKQNAAVFPDIVCTNPSKQTWKSVQGRKLAEFPKLVAELVDDLDVEETAAGCNLRVNWQCAMGHEWEARILNRTSAGSKCPHCSRLRTSLAAPPANCDSVGFTDPVYDRLADETFHKGEPLRTRLGHAVSLAVDGFNVVYAAVCAGAGLEARDDFETLSSNGPRRGVAVDLEAAGVSREAIAEHLRHANSDVSGPYLEERDLPPANALGDVPGWN